MYPKQLKEILYKLENKLHARYATGFFGYCCQASSRLINAHDIHSAVGPFASKCILKSLTLKHTNLGHSTKLWSKPKVHRKPSLFRSFSLSTAYTFIMAKVRPNYSSFINSKEQAVRCKVFAYHDLDYPKSVLRSILSSSGCCHIEKKRETFLVSLRRTLVY